MIDALSDALLLLCLPCALALVWCALRYLAILRAERRDAAEARRRAPSWMEDSE